MIIAISCLIVLIIIVCGLLTPRVRDFIAKQDMMTEQKTAHGHIGASLPDGEKIGTVSAAGFSVSNNGSTTQYYTYGKGTNVKGFVLDFACRAPVDGQYSLTLHSLSKDQEDPYWKYPISQHDGVITYVTDKNGKHYYVSFAPD